MPPVLVARNPEGRRPGTPGLSAGNRGYGGLVAALPDSARELIESGALAHLVTLNADGSPQVTCVWMGIDGDELVCAHLPRHQKVRNMQRDPRVVVSFEGTRHASAGAEGVPRVARPRAHHRGWRA